MEAKKNELKVAIESQKRKVLETSHKSFGSAVSKQQLLAKGRPDLIQSAKLIQAKTPLTPKALVHLSNTFCVKPFLDYTLSAQTGQKHERQSQPEQPPKSHCLESEIAAAQPTVCWSLKPLEAAAERLTAELDFNDRRITNWQKTKLDKVEKCFSSIKKKAIYFFRKNFDVRLSDFKDR